MWIDLSAEWPRILELDSQRQAAKRHYASGLHLSKHSTWLVGLAAEVAVSKTCGQPVDETLRPEGDGGKDFTCDFGPVDVKGNVYYDDPYLVTFLEPRHWSSYYQLVGVDIANRRARIVGWATKDEVKSGEVFDFGHGPRLRLASSELHPGLVPSMEWQ